MTGLRACRIVVVLLALSVTPLVPMTVARAQEGPSPGDAFSYTFHRSVGSGGGEYEGYHDDTNSVGTYRVLSRNTTHVTFHAYYSWTYRDNEGRSEAGSEDRTVSFFAANRTYAGPQDLDEWDTLDPTTLAVWFWVPPNLPLGTPVQILDEDYTVVSVDGTIWSGGSPRRGMVLQAAGSHSRDDAYGNFSYTWTDAYYFDRATGFVIAERYREHDTGTWEGKLASFDWNEDFDIASSTYEVPVDAPVLWGTWASILATLASVAGIGYGYRWRSRSMSRGAYVGSKTDVYRVWQIEEFPVLDNGASEVLGPFLEDFARKALLAGDVVAVAASGSRLVGFASYDREADVGTILCGNTAVTETLRALVGAKDFFSEVRHEVPEQMRREAKEAGVEVKEAFAYNVFETYQVVRRTLGDGIASPYDVSLVSRMTERDLDEVSDLAKRVYKVRPDRWLRAQLRGGDLGFVARVDGRIVGFAFATYADGHGRVHTLTVQPEYRNQGIGKELMRARLAALHALGARDAVAEIADWNLPSLQVAWRHGFRPVGKMYVETSRTVRVRKTIVRR